MRPLPSRGGAVLLEKYESKGPHQERRGLPPAGDDVPPVKNVRSGRPAGISKDQVAHGQSLSLIWSPKRLTGGKRLRPALGGSCYEEGVRRERR